MRQKMKRMMSILLSLALMLVLVRGMSLTVYADTENYPIWIGGTQVTSDNHSGDGWSYTPATEGKDAKLTLNNYTYPGGKGYSDAAIYAEQDLVIELIGENTIVYQQNDKENNCIEVTDSTKTHEYHLTITGSGELTAKVEPSEETMSCAIYADKLTIEKGATVTAISSSTRGSLGVVSLRDTTVCGKLIASANVGSVYPSIGISVNGGSTPQEGCLVVKETGSVIASGGTGAIAGYVKNYIAGTGWTNAEGTMEQTYIPDFSERPQIQPRYKKVQFLTEATVSKAPTANTLTYTGSAQELVTEGTADCGTMYYALSDNAVSAPEFDGTSEALDKKWGISIPKGTNAGTYYVWYMVKGDSYHKNNNPECVTATINKAAATVKNAPTANALTYTGSAQELVTAGTADGGTMQYALGEDETTAPTSDWSESIPAKTDAGTYYVWYKIVGDKDHSDSTAKCVPAKIFEKLKPTVTFKVVNGTWDDGTKSDQIVPLEGSEIDIPKLPSDKIPRAGSKPDDGYKEGAWDEVPVAGTEITKDRTYTYSYIEKDTITKTVTFKVVNGAWDDGATDDKPVTLTGKEGDDLKLTKDQIPTAGKKPNEGYKDGSWDVTPNTETAITENTTYTYTYASKESISRTVTFKVVNGSWDDGDAADKTVTLTGKEGDVLKLAQDQIPAAGKKPNEGYKKGYWDVTPNTETAITADTTYTYKYVSETQEEQTRVEPKSMEEYVISDELKNNTVYTSKEIIEASLRTELHVETEEQANNYSLFDAVLVVSYDDGKNWVKATAENFPEGGILAKFGFPTAADRTQTNGQEYTFKLAHLVETTVGTTKAGTIETPEVTVTEDGLSATLMGLSPVIISWEKKTPVPTEVEITLSAAEMSVTQGREKAITATTKPEGTAVTWSSSDKSVATVDGMGVVTGIKPGTAMITAKITVEGAEYTANCKVTVIPASTPMPIPVPSGSKGGGEHTHNYVWKTIEATEDADGELRYQCETCGDIKERVPLTAYNVFNKNTTEKIRSAKKDATVRIETNKWISFHKMVMEALAERPDVTLEISFLDEGHKGNRCTVVIPKGTDTMSLVDKNGFTGFLFLGGKFGLKTN